MHAPLFSIIINGYRCQDALNEQVAVWRGYAPAMLAAVEFIVVDDGSTPPLEIARDSLPPGAALTLARITEDIPWNMPGARNLGGLLARGRFLIFHDVDHFLPAESLGALIAASSQLQPTAAYRFMRLENDVPTYPHVNSFVCSRAGFWQAGGYDEDFAGHYGHEDGYFRMCWEKFTGVVVQMSDVHLVERPHFRTAGLSRDTTRNSMLLQQKLAEGFSNARPRLRFAWRVV